MVAALPMYDLPELRDATDALWRALRAALQRRGVAAPERLTRGGDLAAQWRARDLLLSQSCGWPFATGICGAARYVATPRHDAPGCEAARYSSALVVRADDRAARDLGAMRGRTLAFNARDSWSGAQALRAALAPLTRGPFFGGALETGGHRASLAAVAEGRADLAAVDCVSFALIGDVAPNEVAGLRVLGWTASAPGLPLISGEAGPPLSTLRAAIADAFADPGLTAARAALRLKGSSVLDARAYAGLVDAAQPHPAFAALIGETAATP